MTLRCLLPLLLAVAAPQASVAEDLARHFAGRAGTIVVLDEASGRVVRIGERRAAERFSPCSTFKIPNALIALEAGVVRTDGSTIAWDAERYPPEEHWPRSWKRNHDLRSAIRNSAVWYFREVAGRVGSERIRERLLALGYGNADTRGGDAFWLSSTLRVSADEQVEFLRGFYRGKLGFSGDATRFVKESIVLEGKEDGSATLSGKTGACPIGDDRFVGWLVGYVEQGDGVRYYALNIEGNSYREIAPLRIEIVKAVLGDLGYW
jgi:beta-lactamase class D